MPTICYGVIPIAGYVRALRINLCLLHQENLPKEKLKMPLQALMLTIFHLCAGYGIRAS